jgi:hypothetical protein
MKAWLKIACLGLLIGTYAAGCTITTDDDDEGIGGARTSGGTTGSGGDSDTGGSQSTGGSESTGGSAGAETSTGGTGGDEPNACQECLSAECANELEACEATSDEVDEDGAAERDGLPDCINEYVAIQDCFAREYEENGLFWNEVDTLCASEGALVEGTILTPTNNLYACTAPDDLDGGCYVECFDFAPEDEGGGGAGGAGS